METEKVDFNWSISEIRKRTRRTVYKKGLKPYLVLILILFIFSFVGIIKSNAASVVSEIDMRIGIGAVKKSDLLRILDWCKNTSVFRAVPRSVRETLLIAIIRNVLTSYSWMINLLGKNQSYMERNTGEVFGFIFILVLLTKGIGSFIKKTFSVGSSRFLMENRIQKDVKIRRLFAPFGNKHFFHIIGVMSIYQIVRVLWGFTIIGGIIKFYQYYFVPFLLAENPDLKWREVRDISKEMTKGYKMKIFLTHISYFYLLILHIIPFFEVFVSLPIGYAVDAEIYMTLRNRPDIDNSKFIEPAFYNTAYVDRIMAGEEVEDSSFEYVLPDIQIKGTDFDKEDKYLLTDFIAMFFIFCFVGWAWEVGIHVVKEHIFRNRGAMYGPWLPIYGAGGVLIIALLNRFKNSKPKLFVYTMLLCGVLEYFTSFVLEFFNNMSYWDYHDMMVNINGRVCLAGLIAFALGGFLGIYILGPIIKNMMRKLGRKKSIIICSILVALFVLDMIACSVFGPNSGEGVGQEYSFNNLLMSFAFLMGFC